MVRGGLVMAAAATALGALVSVAAADCGDDHKTAAESQPPAATTVTEKKVDGKAVIVVTGAPGQSVEVKASPNDAVSATGGAGTAGRAGAAGAAGVVGKPGQ